jgi:hypothetical protein
MTWDIECDQDQDVGAVNTSIFYVLFLDVITLNREIKTVVFCNF